MKYELLLILRAHFSSVSLVIHPSSPIMSLNTVSGRQRYPTPPKPSPKPTANRLRLACDACHQAKTKCLGTSPCLGCQMSAIPCTYSRCNRPGRPKGSKNKRSVIQVKEHKGRQFDTLGLSSPQALWQEPVKFSLAPSVLDIPHPIEELCSPSARSEENENDLFAQVRKAKQPRSLGEDS